VAHNKKKPTVKTTGTTFSHFPHELLYPQAIPGMAVIFVKAEHSFHLMGNIIVVQSIINYSATDVLTASIFYCRPSSCITRYIHNVYAYIFALIQ